MKKYLIFAAAALLSGCSMWNEWNWNWDWNWSALNPWSESKEADTQETQEVQKEESTLPANVNKYLWQASLDKLGFMGITSQNADEGRIITAWSTPSANERFKVVAEIKDGELRGDALEVKVYKEVMSKNGWVKTAPSASFESEIEQAIITQAKILYRQDKDSE